MRSKVRSMGRSTDTPNSRRKLSRKVEGKTLGTRAGTLRDWREASGKTAKDPARHRDATRDGR